MGKPAPIDNDYAKKWTEEAALEFIEKVQAVILENKTYHLQKACYDAGGYHNLWAYLTKLFSENSTVFTAIKKTESMAEARIVDETMTGKIKSTPMAIFYLKNKHGYTDKREIDANVKSEPLDSWLGQFDDQ